MPDQTVISAGLTSNLYHAVEKPVDMVKPMYRNFPEMAPLIAILARLAEGETAQSQVYFTEDQELPDTFIATASAAVGATAVTTTQYSYVRNHTMWVNTRTLEVVLVEDSSIDTTVDIQRGWGTSDAAAIEAGDVFKRLSPAYPENASETHPEEVLDTYDYQYTQEITYWTQHSTRSMYEATHFGGKGTKRDENNRKMVRRARKDLEMATLFSARGDSDISSETGTGNTKSFDGIARRLINGSNYYDFGSSPITVAKVDDWLADIWTAFPDTDMLTAVMSPKIYSRFNQLVADQIRISPMSKEYGLKLNRYNGSMKLDLLRHPLLSGPGFNNMMFVLDFSRMKLIWQKRLELMLDVDTKVKNYTVDKIYGLVTMIMANEARHGFAVNIAA